MGGKRTGASEGVLRLRDGRNSNLTSKKGSKTNRRAESLPNPKGRGQTGEKVTDELMSGHLTKTKK